MSKWKQHIYIWCTWNDQFILGNNDQQVLKFRALQFTQEGIIITTLPVHKTLKDILSAMVMVF